MNILVAFLIPVACIAFGIFMLRGRDPRIGAVAVFYGLGLILVILTEVNIYAALAYLGLWTAITITGWRLEKRHRS